jgi:hypothetical protein
MGEHRQTDQPRDERSAGVGGTIRRRATIVALGALVAVGTAACGTDTTTGSGGSTSTAGPGTTAVAESGTTTVTAPAGAASVPDAEYAAIACTALGEVQDDEAQVVAALESLDPTDGAAWQAAATQLLDDHVTALEQVRAELAEVSPASDPELAGSLDAYVADAGTQFGAISDDLRDADPEAPTFAAAQVTFAADLALVARTLPDPFAGVDDDALLTALADEPGCAAIVAVADPT